MFWLNALPFPFDLAAGQFLVFYAALTAAMLVALWLRRLLRRSGAREEDVRLIQTDDPYRLAYLRSGPEHALRVGTISLIELMF